jgi:hypothetical protein
MEARRDADYARLEAVVAYCRDRRCQRRRLLVYFGEALPADFRCGNCSACGRRTSRPPSDRGSQETVDATTRAFEVVRDAWPDLTRHGPVAPRSLARFLRGVRTGRTPAAWPDLAGFGLFSGLTRHEGERVATEVLDRLSREPRARERVGAPQPPLRPPPQAETTSVPGGAPRAFTREELAVRRVPRSVGLAILRLVASADGALAASGVADILRGSRGCDALRAHPHLAGSELFGALGDRDHEELTADALAMHAKGFLTPVSGSRRFGLTESGRHVLAGARAPARTQATRPSA